MHIRLLLVASVPLLVVLAGCGGEEPPPEDGAMPIGQPADVLSCTEGVRLEGEAEGRAGPDSVSQDPAGALAAYLDGSPDAPDLSPDDFGLLSEQVGRVLYTHQQDGRDVIALVAASGVQGEDGKTGWAVQSWAYCEGAPGA